MKLTLEDQNVQYDVQGFACYNQIVDFFESGPVIKSSANTSAEIGKENTYRN
jgi:hypothetical protein